MTTYHSLIHLIIHLFAQSLINSLTHSLIHLFSITHSFLHSLIHSVPLSFFHSFTLRLPPWLNGYIHFLAPHLLIPSFNLSPIHSFTHSLTHSVSHSYGKIHRWPMLYRWCARIGCQKHGQHQILVCTPIRHELH